MKQERFSDAKRLIVENREQGEKLFATLEKLSEIEPSKKYYKLITTPQDILEVSYDPDMIGIFPIETLDWKIENEEQFTLLVTKGMKYSEEQFIDWLTDHGFTAKKSGDERTFFRQGDTVSVETKKGYLLINFFGSILETIYLEGIEQEDWRFFAS